MIPLWTSAAVDSVVGGTSTLPWSCTGISIDTRTLEPGDLFVPLKSETNDGHLFLSEAAEKGAVAAFVSQETLVSIPNIRVSDTLEALEKLGVASRKRCLALRVGVTGSVGKTTTKEMLRSVFAEQGRTHSNVASYNNQWGVPLTLARMPRDTQFAVFELGMNHVGEIRPLTQMVQPNISLITAIEHAHTEFFASLDEIAQAKAEIFEGMAPGGIVVLNQDIPHYTFLSKLARDRELTVKSFGNRGDFRLLSHAVVSDQSHVRVDIQGQEISYTLPVVGRHWVINSLAVLGIVQLAGANVRKAAETLATFSPLKGRGIRIPGDFTILDESYNANPASMRAALEVLGKSQGKRKIAIIGDMRELGEESQRYHTDLFDPLIKNGIDVIYCCGPYMEALFAKLPKEKQGKYAPTSVELIPFLTEAIHPGDIITIKGSLGTGMKVIVDALIELQGQQKIAS